jgi:hypothetical protein
MNYKLSSYTIAKNCTDLSDIKEGENELKEYFNYCDKTGKKPTTTSYIRFFKLQEKKEKLQNKKNRGS